MSLYKYWKFGVEQCQDIECRKQRKVNRTNEIIVIIEEEEKEEEEEEEEESYVTRVAVAN